MSRKVSTRKRPERDVHMIKEQLKIEEGVFDNRTMMALWRMFNHNIVSRLDFIIAKGKEADVYLADAGSAIAGSLVVLKIFRAETSSFDKRVDYMFGDPRFEKIKKGNVYELVTTWCKKEYGNLKIAQMAEVHAPIPYYFKDNILAIEFIGSDETPARTLRDTTLEDPARVLDTILSDIRKLYGLELVHGDISEYNILIKGVVPYIIDFGQAVVKGHPNAERFLERDVSNIISYFKKRYGIIRDPASELSVIRG
jgi:RIO kinase 1